MGRDWCRPRDPRCDSCRLAPACARLTGRNAEGVGASASFDKGIPDWHIYYHWEHVIEKKTPTPEGCPYTCPYYKGDAPAHYSAEMCPKTTELLSNTVHINIPPQMTESDCDMIAAGIRKCAEVLL